MSRNKVKFTQSLASISAKALFRAGKGVSKDRMKKVKRKKLAQAEEHHELDISNEQFLSLLSSEQLRYISIEDGLWMQCAEGTPEDVEMVLALNEERGHSEVTLSNPVENTRDAIGANPIHVAYMFKNYAVGRYLVKKFPLAGLAGFSEYLPSNFSIEKEGTRQRLRKYVGSKMPYGGLTILHLTILNADYEELEWILKFYKELDIERNAPATYDPIEKVWSPPFKLLRQLLLSRATGTFFAYGTSFGIYCGDTPLHFAVSMNNIRLVRILLGYMEHDDFFSADRYGNNSLHICVANTLPDMFKILIYAAQAFVTVKAVATLGNANVANEEFNPLRNAVLREIFTHALNSDGHTPFTLAAATGNVPIFALHFDEKIDNKDAEMDLLYERVLVCESLAKQLLHSSSIVQSVVEHPPITSDLTESGLYVSLMRHEKWQLGTWGCAVIELDGFDSPHREQADFLSMADTVSFEMVVAAFKISSGVSDEQRESPPELRSALQWIAAGGEDTFELLKLKAVKTLIDAKWRAYGKFVYARGFFLAASFAFMLSCCNILKYNSDDGFIVTSILCVILLGVQILEELKAIYFRGSSYFAHLPSGFAFFRRLCLGTLLGCFIVAVVSNRSFSIKVTQTVSTSKREDGTTLAFAVGLLAAWQYLVFFMIGNEVCILSSFITELAGDIGRFLCMYAVLFASYGCCMTVLNHYTHIYDNIGYQSHLGGAATNLTALLFTFKHLAIGVLSGNFRMPDDTAVSSGLLWLVFLLSISFVILSCTLTYNIFVCVLRKSFEVVARDMQTLVLREKLNILLAYEDTWSPSEMEVARELYSIDCMYSEKRLTHGPYLEVVGK